MNSNSIIIFYKLKENMKASWQHSRYKEIRNHSRRGAERYCRAKSMSKTDTQPWAEGRCKAGWLAVQFGKDIDWRAQKQRSEAQQNLHIFMSPAMDSETEIQRVGYKEQWSGVVLCSWPNAAKATVCVVARL